MMLAAMHNGLRDMLIARNLHTISTVIPHAQEPYTLQLHEDERFDLKEKKIIRTPKFVARSNVGWLNDGRETCMQTEQGSVRAMRQSCFCCGGAPKAHEELRHLHVVLSRSATSVL